MKTQQQGILYVMSAFAFVRKWKHIRTWLYINAAPSYRHLQKGCNVLDALTHWDWILLKHNRLLIHSVCLSGTMNNTRAWKAPSLCMKLKRTEVQQSERQRGGFMLLLPPICPYIYIPYFLLKVRQAWEHNGPFICRACWFKMTLLPPSLWVTWHMSVAREQSWINGTEVIYVCSSLGKRMVTRFPNKIGNM